MGCGVRDGDWCVNGAMRKLGFNRGGKLPPAGVQRRVLRGVAAALPRVLLCPAAAGLTRQPKRRHLPKEPCRAPHLNPPLRWPSAIEGNWSSAERLPGRLRLASKSLFFEPDDVRVPIAR